MSHFERHARERTLRLICILLVAANPVLTLVPAAHIGSPRENGITFNGLILESVAFRSPILKSPGLEIKIKGLAIGIQGQNANVVGFGIGCRWLNWDQ